MKNSTIKLLVACGLCFGYLASINASAATPTAIKPTISPTITVVNHYNTLLITAGSGKTPLTSRVDGMAVEQAGWGQNAIIYTESYQSGYVKILSGEAAACTVNFKINRTGNGFDWTIDKSGANYCQTCPANPYDKRNYLTIYVPKQKCP